MYIQNKKVSRIVALGAVFLAFCLIYIIRMAALELTADNIGGNKSDGTTERTVVVKAQRGQIYDRNGVLLVSNSYSYDLIFDYSVMPRENTERNAVILRATQALELFSGVSPDEHRYPLAGQYPKLEYSEEATDPEGSVYSALIYYFEESGLRSREISRLRDGGMSRTEAAEYFDSQPLEVVDAAKLVDFMLDEYELAIVDGESGSRIYSDGEIDTLLAVRYGMIVTGFSRANDYVLASSLDMGIITPILEWGLQGVWYSSASERVYEYPGYASHILGQTGPIYAEEWEYYKEQGYNMNALVGISGCELAFEEYLRGADGVKVIVEDKDGNIVNEYMKTEPRAGQDVYLTIDIDLQITAEDALRDNVAYVNNYVSGSKSRAGALSAIDPSSGEVLVLASYPTFDLTTLNEDYASLSNDDAIPLLNRALNGTYAPGSTFKPGVALAALNENTVSAHQLVNCNGIYTYYSSYQPRCWVYNSASSSISRHGNIDVIEALRVSCNCYFYDVGRCVGIDTLNRYCRAYGLGEETGIELSEATGSLAGPNYRELNHLISWQPTDTIAASIGQSDNAFTPLQLGVYLSTLVNRGTRYSSHLLLKVTDFASGDEVYRSIPQVVDSIELSEENVDTVIEGMVQVVETNSIVKRFMKNLPVSVAGKTGTAQVGGKEADNGLFICCAPSDSPQIVISAVIERCGSGSYASMAAAEVIEKYCEKYAN